MHQIKSAKLLFFIIFPLLMMLPSGILARDTSRSFQENSVVLNPSFKVKRMSNGTVVVSAPKEDGTIVKHEFRDFYADLILAAHRKQRMSLILKNLSKKYYLSEDECRREVKHALNQLTEWQIVIRDDKVL